MNVLLGFEDADKGRIGGLRKGEPRYIVPVPTRSVVLLANCLSRDALLVASRLELKRFVRAGFVLRHPTSNQFIQVAAKSVEALMRGDRTVVPGWPNKLYVHLLAPLVSVVDVGRGEESAAASRPTHASRPSFVVNDVYAVLNPRSLFRVVPGVFSHLRAC